jgi:hypothetical protein
LKTNGSLSQAALLLSKLKLTVIYISRFKMRPETSRGLWSVKYHPNRSGAIRNRVFSWTPTRFPFHTNSAKKLTLNQTSVITVIGKAFFDVGHSLKDQKSNRRRHLPDYAAWEIHPVMKIDVAD